MGKLVHGRTVVLASVAAFAGGVPAADARPNLKVTKVANGPKTAVLGGSFRVADTVANKGRKRAKASATRFYLSEDRKRTLADLRLGGAREVPALAPRKRSAAPRRRQARVTVDLGAPRGEYYLLACADDREAVAESREGDNCRAARRRLRVTAPLTVFTGLRFNAIADTTPPPIDDEQEQVRLVGQKYRCTPVPSVRVPSADEAIENITKSIEAQVGKADYAAFRKSPQYKKEKAAAEAAMAAFMLETPGAALAATIRAHQLDPKDASHLANAAGLASSVGMPNEALALLDAAERLDEKQRAPMGISREAMALQTRAHALASLGDYRRAVQLADAALAIEPLLTEAEQTAGMAELCAGRTPVAVARVKKGRKRQPGKEPPLDDSKGKESELRNLPLPATPPQAVELVDFYRDQQQGFLDEIQQRNARETALRQRVNARQTAPSRTLNQRLLHAVHMAGADPKLRAMSEDRAALLEKAHNWYREKFCDGDSCHDEAWQQLVAGCEDVECRRARCVPATKDWHQGWLNDQTALYETSKAYFRALSKRMSGLAAHIGDADTYELAMLAIESQEQSIYSGVQQAAFYWSDWVRRAKEDCVEGFEPPPATTGTEPSDAQGSGPCPTGLDSFNFVIPLNVLSVKVNCNEIQIGASTTKWLGGFAEVTHNFRTGKSTMFAGVQAGVSAGPIKADFKSGIYVTSSSQGVEDIGMRAGPGTQIGAGPVEISGPSDYVDISFVPVFASS